MDRPHIFRALLTTFFVIALLSVVQAAASIKTLSGDTANYQRQDEKKEKSRKKPDNKQEPVKPDIREVPKARKQSRPPVVVKPKIKAKPIKVIRPNIKRP